MNITVSRLFRAFELVERNRYGEDTTKKHEVLTEISRLLRGCQSEVVVHDRKAELISPFFEDENVLEQDVVFSTGAYFWGQGDLVMIKIAQKNRQVFVNRIPVSIEYPGPILRLRAGHGTYGIFNDDGLHRCHPPVPIEEMVKRLR